ncbi:MAG: hypothetical protein JWN70_6575 [Planctomycetaceae bacterium]|nr:hypothetical protein [Planctomycetaceae bacterium]
MWCSTIQSDSASFQRVLSRCQIEFVDFERHAGVAILTQAIFFLQLISRSVRKITKNYWTIRQVCCMICSRVLGPSRAATKRFVCRIVGALLADWFLVKDRPEGQFDRVSVRPAGRFHIRGISPLK